MEMQVLNAIYDISVVPVFYHPDLETAKNVVAAISRGGCKLVEFVNRGDHAWQVFSELERHFMKADPSLILGVGSIVEADPADEVGQRRERPHRAQRLLPDRRLPFRGRRRPRRLRLPLQLAPLPRTPVSHPTRGDHELVGVLRS